MKTREESWWDWVEREDPQAIVKQWQQGQFKFRILKQNMDYLGDYYNGYCNGPIRLGESLAEGEVEAHGGVTLYQEEPDGSTTYGFDTLHAFDETNPLLKDLDWMTAACERMAESVIALGGLPQRAPSDTSTAP